MVDPSPEDQTEDETASAADRFGLVGFVLEGKYRLDRVVAEGGFAVVYHGTHLRLGQPIAVKVLKLAGELDTDDPQGFVARFAAEARTLAGLTHPAIVKVIDFGAAEVPAGGVAPWMVLEWIDGVTLDRHLRARRGGASPGEVLRLLRPALEALADAHDLGVAHRDLKPANMMLLQGRRGTRVKLLDFGIAKRMGDDESAGSGATRTASTLQAFSPRYAAPEQCGSTRTGPWTDVHAMGLILVEALTDRSAYPGGGLGEGLAAALSPVRPTPAARGCDVGPWEPILARALALNPADRFQHAGALLDALEASTAQADAAWGARASQGHWGAVGVEASQPISREDTTLSGSAVVSQVPAAPAPAPPQGAQGRARMQRQALWVLAGAAVTVALSVGVLQWFPAKQGSAATVRAASAEAPVRAEPVRPASPPPAPEAAPEAAPEPAPEAAPEAPGAPVPPPQTGPSEATPSPSRRHHRARTGERRDEARARRVRSRAP